MFTIATIGLWFVTALIDYSEFCYTWQLKTYLWSRFRDFLTTKQGKEYWWRYRTGKQWLLALALFGATSVLDIDNRGAEWLLASFFLLNLVYTIREFRHKRFRRPTMTPVAAGMIGASLLAEGGVVLIIGDPNILFITAALRFVIISVFCGLIEPPRQFMISWRLYRAKKKLDHYPHLTIIGITGSYGKSTVKEFLSTILSEQFRVIKTPENINADIGISRFILNTDFRDADVFVVEMGAYRRGHIARVAKYVRPHIGILIAINEQHVSLFGSIRNTQQAKYELLRSVRPGGLAITNSDNAYCRELLPTLTTPVQTFGLNEDYAPTATVVSTDDRGSATTMRVRIAQNIETIHIPTVFLPYILNILPCLMVSKHLGMPETAIDKGLTKLVLPKHGTRVYQYGRATIIDDSYSSNTDGFRLALRRLETLGHQKKKILITRGLIELGDLNDSIHEALGDEIAAVADEVAIITPDAAEPLRRGISRTKSTVTVHRQYDADALVAYVRKYRDSNVVILIENRIPSALKKELESV